MKVDYYKDKIVVYLINKKINLETNDIRNILFEVFNMLIENYDIKLDGSYNINLYTNELYGVIVEIINLESNNYDSDTISIKLNILNNKLFLYEIEDPLGYTDNEVYFYNNKYYLNINKMDIELLEKSNVIYDDYVYKILGKGVKI